MTALNVIVEDFAGHAYRVCFAEREKGWQSPVIIRRQLANGHEGQNIDPQGVRGRELLGDVRGCASIAGLIAHYNVYHWRTTGFRRTGALIKTLGDATLVWSGLAEDFRDAIAQARKSGGLAKETTALFTRVSGDDPYEVAS